MKNIQESVIDKSRQKFILENQHVFQKFWCFSYLSI
jgi:hypothetical protein